MFLKNFMDSREGREISKVARESTTYNAFYEYWRDQLFERVMRLFVWENTEKITKNYWHMLENMIIYRHKSWWIVEYAQKYLLYGDDSGG